MTTTTAITITPGGLVDIAGAGEYLGQSVRTIRWLTRTKKLGHVKIGKRLMFKVTDLDGYIEKHYQGALDEA